MLLYAGKSQPAKRNEIQTDPSNQNLPLTSPTGFVNHDLNFGELKGASWMSTTEIE